MLEKFKHSIKESADFFKSLDFLKALTVLLALSFPLIFLAQTHIEFAVSMIMGVFVAVPANIPGNKKHVFTGILLGVLLGTFTFLILQLSALNPILLIVALSFITFFNALISVYGFRASLISFSGLIAIIFSLARPLAGMEILVHAGLMIAGGMIYLVISLISNLLLSHRVKNELLAESIALTADYIRKRIELMNEITPESQQELLDIHQKIAERHEKLRDLFFSEGKSTSISESTEKQILVFIESVEILELIIANPANYVMVRKEFKDNFALMTPFILVLHAIADSLEAFSRDLKVNRSEVKPLSISEVSKKLESAEIYFDSLNAENLNSDSLQLLRNLLDYEQKQLSKLQVIEKILYEGVRDKSRTDRFKNAKDFVPSLNYSPRIILENLSFDSQIFRHSLRLTIAVVSALFLGIVLDLQNAYWIVMTVIVILRPGYGLTKDRTKQRLIGTAIGAGIAFLIVQLTDNEIVYGVLAVLSLILGFSLVQRNYRSSAIFVTLNVVFLYALMTPSVWEVISFRVLDTAVGALISFLAIRFIFPSWESATIMGQLNKSLNANLNYLKQVFSSVADTQSTTLKYKLARKEAFIEMGNLNAASQRLSQDPKSQREHKEHFTEMVLLNHNLLMATASLSIYLQKNAPDVSAEAIERLGQPVIERMQHMIDTPANLLEESVNDLKMSDDSDFFKEQIRWIRQLAERMARTAKLVYPKSQVL